MNLSRLPRAIDCRPETLRQDIAPGQQAFTLILFDIKPGTCILSSEELIKKVDNIFGIPDIRILRDENQLIVLTVESTLGIENSINDVESFLDCKTGMVTYPEDGNSLQALAKKAYHACRTCSTDLRNSIKRALNDDEFFLVYQPQVNTRTLITTGAEALIRWKPSGSENVIMPMEFLPHCEQNGLINEICKWTLYQACRQSLIWETRGEALKIAVNISTAYLLEDAFLDDLDKVLKKTGINPEHLEIELTENSLIHSENIVEVDEVVQKVRARGITVSLDDFGMKYNTLETLRVLTVDRLKVDRMFVNEIETEKGEVIVQAIIAIARSMNLDCIAEGVETTRQAVILEKMGCFDMQGYLFGKPNISFPKIQKVS